MTLVSPGMSKRNVLGRLSFIINGQPLTTVADIKPFNPLPKIISHVLVQVSLVNFIEDEWWTYT